MATDVGSLAVTLDLDMASFEKDMKGLESKLKDVGKGMQDVGKGMTKYVTGPILGAAGGIGALAIKAGNFADELLDLEAATGINTDALQQFREAEVKAGVSSDSIAGSIERMNRQMREGGEYSTGVTSAALDMGVALETASGQVRDASDVTRDLMLALSDIEDPQERARKGAEAFGRDWENVAPIVALGRDELEKMHDTDVISRENLESANDFRVALDEMKHELSQAAMEAGANLAPVMTELAGLFSEKVVPIIVSLSEKLIELAEWFANLSPEMQAMIGIAVGIVAALGPFLLILGKIIATISTLMPLVKAIGVGIAGLSAPVAIAIAAVVALIAIGVALYKNWEEVKAFAANLRDSLANTFENIKSAISTKINDTKDAITEGIQGALDFVTGLASTFKDAGKGIVESITNGIMSVITKPVDAVKDMAGRIRDFLPFSPAKDGPLKDLNRLDFGGPIIDSIRHDVRGVQGAMAGMLSPSMPSGAGTGGGSANIIVELDGRTIAKAVGQPLVDEIRMKTGMRI